jgi:hypothetical protein
MTKIYDRSIVECYLSIETDVSKDRNTFMFRARQCKQPRPKMSIKMMTSRR